MAYRKAKYSLVRYTLAYRKAKYSLVRYNIGIFSVSYDTELLEKETPGFIPHASEKTGLIRLLKIRITRQARV